MCVVLQCVKHTLNVKHKFSEGLWGHVPPGKFLKLVTLRLNLVLSEAIKLDNCWWCAV